MYLWLRSVDRKENPAFDDHQTTPAKPVGFISRALVTVAAHPPSETRKSARVQVARVQNPHWTRLSAAEVRCQLVSQNGYIPEGLLSEETIRTRLPQLGYDPSKVEKPISPEMPSPMPSLSSC